MSGDSTWRWPITRAISTVALVWDSTWCNEFLCSCLCLAFSRQVLTCMQRGYLIPSPSVSCKWIKWLNVHFGRRNFNLGLSLCILLCLIFTHERFTFKPRVDHANSGTASSEPFSAHCTASNEGLTLWSSGWIIIPAIIWFMTATISVEHVWGLARC